MVSPASENKRPPTTGAALVERARAKNRWMAIGMAGFVIAVFLGLMVAVLVNKRYAVAQRHDPVSHAAVR